VYKLLNKTSLTVVYETFVKTALIPTVVIGFILAIYESIPTQQDG
jgi:hypothetical protein